MMSDLTLLDQHSLLIFFIVLAHCDNSQLVEMLLHSDTLFWFPANQSLILLLNAPYLTEKQQLPILWSLIWPQELDTLSITIHYSQWWENSGVCNIKKHKTLFFYNAMWHFYWYCLCMACGLTQPGLEPMIHDVTSRMRIIKNMKDLGHI